MDPLGPNFRPNENIASEGKFFDCLLTSFKNEKKEVTRLCLGAVRFVLLRVGHSQKSRQENPLVKIFGPVLKTIVLCEPNGKSFMIGSVYNSHCVSFVTGCKCPSSFSGVSG